jgi:hypothetical protein
LLSKLSGRDHQRQHDEELRKLREEVEQLSTFAADRPGRVRLLFERLKASALGVRAI